MNTTKIIVDFPGYVTEESKKLPINILRTFVLYCLSNLTKSEGNTLKFGLRLCLCALNMFRG